MTLASGTSSRRRFLLAACGVMPVFAGFVAGWRRLRWHHSHSQSWRAQQAGVLEKGTGVYRLRCDNGAVYETNETGLFLWRLCDGEHTAAGMAKALSDATGAPRGRALRDVQRFVSAMAREGLVSRA